MMRTGRTPGDSYLLVRYKQRHYISSFVNASFVGTMPDTLIIHYAKHKRETGIMKMKKVRMHDNVEKDDMMNLLFSA